jgi:hypothetical protein
MQVCSSDILSVDSGRGFNNYYTYAFNFYLITHLLLHKFMSLNELIANFLC